VTLDTTEKNIKMLEKATEIQKNAPEPKYGDLWAYANHPRYGGWTVEYIGENYKHEPGHTYIGERIWLPRQDELQEIWLEAFPNELILVRFFDWWNNLGYSDANSLDSMEQLWLAFVMKENYTKVWDDQKEDWVKLPNEG